MRSDQVRETDPWARGVVLSFDFVTKDLKDYYSKNSPQGAYEVLKRFLLKNGFEHLRDSDYKNKFMDKVDTVDLLYSFSRDHKWFPHCINKVNISPNITALDISNDIKALGDEAELTHTFFYFANCVIFKWIIRFFILFSSFFFS